MRRFTQLNKYDNNICSFSNNITAKRYLTGGESFLLISIFTCSSVLSQLLVKKLIDTQPRLLGDNLIKNVNINKNSYVFDNNIKNKIDNIVFFCDEQVKCKIKEFEKKINFTNINSKNYVLLTGPPGCGKTHLASYISEKLNKKLLSINLSELKSPWVGDEGSKLNTILKKLDSYYDNNHVVIFDEIDTIVSHRSFDSVASKDASATINILLSWMDGINTNNNEKLILFTTNKKKELSNAFLDRIAYNINFDGITKEQLKEYWKIHLTHLSEFEFDKLSNLQLNSFRKANNILKFVVLNKIKNNDSSDINVEEIDKAFLYFQ